MDRRDWRTLVAARREARLERFKVVFIPFAAAVAEGLALSRCDVEEPAWYVSVTRTDVHRQEAGVWMTHGYSI